MTSPPSGTPNPSWPPPAPDRERHVVIAGWSGTTNLGDELLLRALLGLLARRQCTATVVSTNPEATASTHGVDSIPLGDVRGLWRALRHSDGLIVGPGTLIQDQTSPASLPWHLGRVPTAKTARIPVVGIGLGAGPLRRRGSRTLVGTTLRRVGAITVRDHHSAGLLAGCGVRNVAVGGDLVLGLDPPGTLPQGRVVVSLRAHHPGGSIVPLRKRPTHAWDPDRIAALARGLDDVAGTTGLPLHFVAFDTDHDTEFHERVAARVRTAHTTEVPDLDGVLAAVGSGDVVVAMRLHAAMAAVVTGRPTVLIGYTDKVNALAAELAGANGAATHVTDDPQGWQALGQAATGVAGHAADMADARTRLAVNLWVHGAALDTLWRNPAQHRGSLHDQ